MLSMVSRSSMSLHNTLFIVNLLCIRIDQLMFRIILDMGLHDLLPSSLEIRRVFTFKINELVIYLLQWVLGKLIRKLLKIIINKLCKKILRMLKVVIGYLEPK